MTIQLIQGHFTAHEAIDIITKMGRLKIRFHEDKFMLMPTKKIFK